jgi:CHAT domain-containing protein/Tfp pilus assembly protein PilF
VVLLLAAGCSALRVEEPVPQTVVVSRAGAVAQPPAPAGTPPPAAPGGAVAREATVSAPPAAAAATGPAPSSPAAVAAIERADALLQAGDAAAAVDVLAAAQSAAPGDVELAAALAEAATQAGKADVARAAYQSAVASAAAAGDFAAVEVYNGAVEDLARAVPEWAAAATERAAGLTGEQSAGDAQARFDALREQVAAAIDAGDAAQARSLAEEALDVAEQGFGESHLLTILALRDAANTAFMDGDAFAAESMLLLAQERSIAALGKGHPDTIDVMMAVADLAEQAGNLDAAVATYNEIDAAIAEGVGPGSLVGLDASLARAQLLDRTGYFDEGADLMEATCAGYAALLGRLHPAHANCRAVLGGMLSRAGDLAGGEAAYAEALDVYGRIHPAEHPQVLAVGAEAAEVDRLAGRLDEALASLEALSERAAASGDAEAQAHVNGFLARVYEDKGRLADALQMHGDVYRYHLQNAGQDDPATLGALNFVAGVQRKLGLLNESEASYRAALDGYRRVFGDKDPTTITLMNNLGVALEQAGLYDEAEPLLRESQNLAEEILGPAHPTTLRNMNNLALLYESQGNFDRAEPLYSVALQVLTAELGAEHPDAVAVANNLAYLYMLQQDHARAAEMFARAHESWRSALGAGHQNTLKAQNNLARTYLALGRLDEAEALFGEALALRREHLGPKHMDTLRSLQDTGALYLAQGRLDDAEATLAEALSLCEEVLGEQHPYTFEALNRLAEVLAAQGRADAAFDLRQRGFQRRTRFLDRMLWVASENGREGYIRLHRPELDAYLQAVMTLPEDRAGREVLDVGLQRKGLLLRVASEIQQITALGIDSEVGQVAEALATARKELAASTLAGPQDADGEAHLRKVRDLERRVEELEGQLGRVSVTFRERAVEHTVDDLAAALADGATLVDFIVYETAGGPRLAAGVLRRDGGVPTIGRIDYDYTAVAAAIDEYREIVQDEAAPDDEVLQVGQALYDLLWAPLEPLLGDGAVHVVPDGQLNILPFDALPNADGEYLLTTTDLHVLSSSRDLLPTEVPLASAGDVLLLAGPDYDTEEAAGAAVLAQARSRAATRSRSLAEPPPPADSPAEASAADGETRGRGVQADVLRGLSLDDIDSRSAVVKASLRAASSGMRGLRFSPLPGAEEEGRLIDEQVRAAGLANAFFTRVAAEEQVLVNRDAAPRVLHMATHGFFLRPSDELRKRLLAMQRGADVTVPPPGDNPLLRSGLAFAGINSNAPYLGEIDTNNDGVLTALEVLGLNLAGTELAVLSACETGLGEIHIGEGVYGLRRAFREAGAREIVMSLWEVSDAGTQALMTEMYARLIAGDAPREALRGAQKKLLEDPRWGYPYVWAAFSVVGS